MSSVYTFSSSYKREVPISRAIENVGENVKKEIIAAIDSSYEQQRLVTANQNWIYCAVKEWLTPWQEQTIKIFHMYKNTQQVPRLPTQPSGLDEGWQLEA